MSDLERLVGEPCPPGIPGEAWEGMQAWVTWMTNPLNARDGKTINFADLKRLSVFCLTDAELAAFFNMSEQTFITRKQRDKRIQQIIDKGREMGKASLRRRQWVKAVIEGDTAMLKHLGEQYLGQSKKIAQTNGIDPEKLEHAMRDAWNNIQKDMKIVDSSAVEITEDTSKNLISTSLK